MNGREVEAKFNHQVSKYKPRASFRRGAKLLFRRHLSTANRAMVWVHKDRYEEIARVAEATGLTMSTVTDTLIRFSLNNMVVVDDDGKDIELRQYLDMILGAHQVTDEDVSSILGQDDVDNNSQE